MFLFAFLAIQKYRLAYFTKIISLSPSITRRTTSCKICDLGNAVQLSQNGEQKHSIIQTRHYRAPEVILELGWGTPSDIWSCGVIAAELFKGSVVFHPEHDREQMKMMQNLLGVVPQWMRERASPHRQEYFSRRSGRVIYPEPGVDEDTTYADRVKPLNQTISRDKYPLLNSFIARCLVYDPNERITAAKSLEHPFFSVEK